MGAAMEKRYQIALGAGMIGLGGLFLLGVLLQFNVWAICWPVGLIGLGLWLLLRPHFTADAANQTFLLLGEARRRGNWLVKNEEYFTGVADIDLDFTETDLPPGETHLRLYGFVNDVVLLLPKTMGLRLRIMAIVMDCDLFGRESERFFSPLEYTSDNLETAEHCLQIDITSFVADVKLRRF